MLKMAQRTPLSPILFILLRPTGIDEWLRVLYAYNEDIEHTWVKFKCLKND